MTEQWKPIRGFDTYYEVSDCGNVRSLDRRVALGVGKSRTKIHYGRTLTLSLDSAGYHRVDLCAAGLGIERKAAKVHQLVAEAFVGPRPSELHGVNHKNGLKTDNRPENLEWVLQKENMAHAGHTGLMLRGEAQRASKTTDEEVRQMREMRRQGARLHVIAEKFGLSTSTVCQIVKGTWWKHAPLADYRPPPTHVWLQGENSPSAKLTEAGVREIRRLYATGEYTQKQIGAMYGVTNVSISSVIIGKTWAHVTDSAREMRAGDDA